MPLYDYRSEDGQVISVLMDTKQPAEAYQVQIRNGVTYKRVYYVPHMSVDTRGGTTAADYARKTQGKNMTVGQMTDLSKEMSHERAAKEGRDPVKEKHFADYEKRMGTKHKDAVKQEREAARTGRLAKAKKNLAKYGVKVEL